MWFSFLIRPVCSRSTNKTNAFPHAVAAGGKVACIYDFMVSFKIQTINVNYFLVWYQGLGYCYANSGVYLPRPYKYINLVLFGTNRVVNPLISYWEIATSTEQRPAPQLSLLKVIIVMHLMFLLCFSLFLPLNKKVGLILEQALSFKVERWDHGRIKRSNASNNRQYCWWEQSLSLLLPFPCPLLPS